MLIKAVFFEVGSVSAVATPFAPVFVLLMAVHLEIGSVIAHFRSR
jgi:hypothetical protein